MAGTLTISTLSDGTNSTSSTNCIQGSAKAWVNFNGSTPPVIRASYNVSSVTRVGAGIYTVNFTNALADANFATIVSTSSLGLGTYGAFSNIVGTTTSTIVPTTSTTTIYTGYTTGQFDQTYVSVAVFR